MLQLEAYTGYLRPWMPDIIAAYLRGALPEQIARALRETEPRECAYTSGNTVAYALRKVGVYFDRVKNDHAQRRAEAWRLRQDGLSLREIGKQLSVTPERVRQMLRRVQQEHDRQAWRDHCDEVREQVLAEWRETPGRPIDMGGPRGQWLERSPWDDL